MRTSESPTYVLKYTPQTITAIARAENAGEAHQNVQYDVHVTTDEDSSVQQTAKGWRTICKDDGDLFIVEVESGVPSSQFELPFAHAVSFADNAQKELAQRRVSTTPQIST